MPRPLPAVRCALTAPFHPYRSMTCTGRRFAFCGTVPGVAPAGRYPAPCFRGARTFLPASLATRRATIQPSGGGDVVRRGGGVKSGIGDPCPIAAGRALKRGCRAASIEKDDERALRERPSVTSTVRFVRRVS